MDAAIATVYPNRRGKWFIAVVVGYFALHVAIRVCSSEALQQDEAEQVIIAQTLQAGSGMQPPLYNWVQFAFFDVLGTGVLALAIWKNLLLALVYLLTFLAALRISGDRRLAVIAAVLLIFFWPLSWDAQRDKTHSVLATALVLGTFLSFLSVRESPRLLSYVGLGACIGLGALSKYNYLMFPAALVAVALTDRRSRRVFLHPAFAVSLVAALLVSMPHLIWLWNHWESSAVITRLRGRLGVGESDMWRGSLRLGAVMGSAFGPLLGIILVLFPAAVRCHSDEPERFPTGRLLGFIGLGFVALVVSGVSNFGEHWLMPFGVLVPVCFVARIEWDHVAGSVRRFAFLAATSALGILVVTALLAPGPWTVKPTRLSVPIAPLAEALREQGFERGLVVSDDPRLAAGLRLQAPDRMAAATLEEPPTPPDSAGDLAIVWRIQPGGRADVPGSLVRRAAAIARPSVPDVLASVRLPNQGADNTYSEFGIAVWHGAANGAPPRGRGFSAVRPRPEMSGIPGSTQPPDAETAFDQRDHSR